MIIYLYAKIYKRWSAKEDMRNAKCFRLLTFKILYSRSFNKSHQSVLVIIRLERFQNPWKMENKICNDFKVQGIHNKKFQQSGLLRPGVDH